jgi:hypothetical protein
MRTLRAVALLALLLISVTVVIASPAFATPNATASSGTRVAQPFITPLGSTSSMSTLLSTDLSLAIGGAVISCRTTHISAYVPATHTQSLITSFTIGNGAGGTCLVTHRGFGGTVDQNSIREPTLSSTRPAVLHFTTILAGTSDTGTLNLSGAITFTYTFAFTSCNLTIPIQSIRSTETWTTRSYVFNDRTVVTTIVGAVCPASGNATLTAIFTERHDTVRDGNLRSTTAS